MANITLMGASYTDVPAVTLPQTGGGTVTFYENGGGVTAAAEKLVNFVDYDGTILYSYDATEFSSLTTLPANPSHNGLTAQGWNWTLSDIASQIAAMPKAPVWVGQHYVTTSGATEIDITLDNHNKLSPYLVMGVTGSVTVDWGDGTTQTTVSDTSEWTALKYTQHVYSAVGKYTISITPVNNSTFRFRESSSAAGSILSNVSGIATNVYYSSCVTAIRFGPVARVAGNAFRHLHSLETITYPSTFNDITIGQTFIHCRSLRCIVVPSGATSICTSFAASCYSLKRICLPYSLTTLNGESLASLSTINSVTIPKNVTSISSYGIWGCSTARTVYLPNGITSIPSNCFYNGTGLLTLTIPASVTSISASAFSGCNNMAEYHFLSSTPPTLANANAFSGIPSGCVIYVPGASLSTYKSASIWADFASYIQAEP